MVGGDVFSSKYYAAPFLGSRPVSAEARGPSPPARSKASPGLEMGRIRKAAGR